MKNKKMFPAYYSFPNNIVLRTTNIIKYKISVIKIINIPEAYYTAYKFADDIKIL